MASLAAATVFHTGLAFGEDRAFPSSSLHSWKPKVTGQIGYLPARVSFTSTTFRFSALRCSAAATEANTLQRKSSSATTSRTGVANTPKLDEGGPGFPPFFFRGGGGGGGGGGSSSSGGFVLFLILVVLDYLKEREKEQSKKRGDRYDYSM